MNPADPTTMKLLALGLLLLPGCVGLTPMGGARTLPPGESESWTAGYLGRLRDQNAQQTTLLREEAGVRHGFTERLEGGFRLFGLGGGLDGKLQLLRSDSPDAGLDLALGVSAVAWATRQLTGGELVVPLLVGLNLSGGHQLVLAPRLGATTVSGKQLTTPGVLSLGATLGLKLRVSDWLSLLPELLVAFPLGESPLAKSYAQLGFGVLLGRPK